MSAHLNCEEIRISNSDIDVNFVHSSFPECLDCTQMFKVVLKALAKP